MTLEFSQQIFEKSSNIKFHENPSSGSRVVQCGGTDMTTLIVVFAIFRTRLNPSDTGAACGKYTPGRKKQSYSFPCPNL